MTERPWRVLVLCAGRSTSVLRPELIRHLEDLDFEANVYSEPGYLADPSLDNVSACVEAIDQHDIVLAVIDTEEGSEVDPGPLDAGVRRYLLEHELLPAPGSAAPSPTIVQLEVGVARAQGKPTLVLISEEARRARRTVEEMLKKGEVQPQPRGPGARPATELIEASDWEQLDVDYEVPSGDLASFRHFRFIADLESATNAAWVRGYGETKLEELKRKATDALAGVPQALIRAGFGKARPMLETERPPVGGPSLADLLDAGLIQVPPYHLRSGRGDGDLYSPGEEEGQLGKWLLERRSVLLLGDPGLGKSTVALLTYASLEEPAKAVPALGVIRGRWRDLAVPDENWEATLRRLIGLAHGRAPWPQALKLPQLPWILILDGIDESPLLSTDATKTLRRLGEEATLLVTCRRSDHQRYLEAEGSTFAVIAELEPWGEERLQHYADALESSGRPVPAGAVRELLRLKQGPKLISYPLWLSMLTYLAEHEADLEVGQLDDYVLLQRTMGAVAKEEATRHGEVDPKALEETWQRMAWTLHCRRRERQGPLSKAELAADLDLGIDEPLFNAACSMLEISDQRVSGFRHEVIHDYWLGEEIAARLSEADAAEIVDLLGRQRSSLANDAVRSRLRTNGQAADTAAGLRERFSEVPEGPCEEFVKNQMLYFIGRLDPNKSSAFLARIWHSTEEAEFVRYSAAFNGAMVGAEGVEEDYYQYLLENSEAESLNRGYHLFYHGDIDVNESEMPYRDEDYSVSAERAIEVLIRRLRMTEPENRRLRRIELLTLRRFIETRKQPRNEALEALETALVAIEIESKKDPRRSSIETEIATLRRVAGIEPISIDKD